VWRRNRGATERIVAAIDRLLEQIGVDHRLQGSLPSSRSPSSDVAARAPPTPIAVHTTITNTAPQVAATPA
jgi:hypothetical protein